VALSLVGCFFVVRAYDVSGLDALGVLAAFGSMLTFAIYVVGSERSGQRHEAVTTLFWAFGFATLFWALVTPWWSFPGGARVHAQRAARRRARGRRHARLLLPDGRGAAPLSRPSGWR
jgi:drug/metabolite transporter (DMT)-like permease